jgi:hypothetical protein
MKVRDEILVLRPVNGGMDLPLVFELESEEQNAIVEYLAPYFGVLVHGGRMEEVPMPIFEAACRLAERGIPQGITHLVGHELLARGRLKDAELLEPFVVGVK